MLIGLVVQSLDEMKSQFPDADFEEFNPQGNMTVYPDVRAFIDPGKSPPFIYCQSCDMYVSQLLESEKDVPLDTSRPNSLRNKMKLIQTIYSCPVCKNYVGELTTSRGMRQS